nr:DUF6089 family protein [Bacteroidales bacterium]
VLVVKVLPNCKGKAVAQVHSTWYNNLGLEAEYGFRKTFYDNFDGLTDFVDPDEHGWIHNNDWYSYTGISFTWKIYNKLAGCPVYNDVKSGKKKKR